MHTVRGMTGVGALLLSCALLTACGGGGGGDDGGGTAGTPPTIGFTAVEVSGATDTAATVTVNGVADADGVEDSAWRAVLPMDGSALPSVAGTTYAATITVSATDTEARTATSAVTIAIAP